MQPNSGLYGLKGQGRMRQVNKKPMNKPKPPTRGISPACCFLPPGKSIRPTFGAMRRKKNKLKAVIIPAINIGKK